jgi:hypothetical protein
MLIATDTVQQLSSSRRPVRSRRRRGNGMPREPADGIGATMATRMPDAINTAVRYAQARRDLPALCIGVMIVTLNT